MNCNICDQLAAEMGELLLKIKTATGGVDGESMPPEQSEKIETALRSARQKLIDHMRLIHGSPA